MIWFENRVIFNIQVETGEGPIYPASLYISKGASYEHSELYLYKLSPLLPGFRFSVYEETLPLSYSIRWRSATAATPARIIFPDNPELSFDLHEGMEINFPFDKPPIPFDTFKSLAGKEIPGQLINIQNSFTGRCFVIEDHYGYSTFWLEFSMKNLDRFNETMGRIDLPHIAYFYDGYYRYDERSRAILNLFEEQEGAHLIDLSVISLGPGQSAIGHIALGTHQFNNTDISAIIALLWPDGSYQVYDTSSCIMQ
jgi:hypothetical protein